MLPFLVILAFVLSTFWFLPRLISLYRGTRSKRVQPPKASEFREDETQIRRYKELLHRLDLAEHSLPVYDRVLFSLALANALYRTQKYQDALQVLEQMPRELKLPHRYQQYHDSLKDLLTQGVSVQWKPIETPAPHAFEEELSKNATTRASLYLRQRL